MAAATVNPTDMGMTSGRQAATLDALTPPYVPGMELAGTIDAVGADVDWQVGDRVMAIVLPMRTGRGGQAELVIAPAQSVAQVPDGMSLQAAATIPMNGLTARRALDLLALKSGQTVAVTGAAGAVGGYVVQLAVADGLRVIGVSAAGDEALVRGLGAHDFVARGDAMIHNILQLAPGGVAGLVDTAVIGRPLLPAIRDGGGLAVVRGWEGDVERGITVHQVRVSDYALNHSALDRLGQMASQGKLTPRIAETFPPERAAEAHRKLAAGGVRGRLIIVF